MSAARLEGLGSREVIVFKGASDPVFSHAIGKSGDTEGNIDSGGAASVSG
ncbi:hypothetical protein [Tunturiibacter lichenicola]|jgi:hypothetical protein